MEPTTPPWEQTLATLLPLVDTRMWMTTYVDGAPVSASASASSDPGLGQKDRGGSDGGSAL
jgi:hypothetical protein